MEGESWEGEEARAPVSPGAWRVEGAGWARSPRTQAPRLSDREMLAGKTLEAPLPALM